MNETNFSENLEAEIAQLNREIEEKRALLEREKGIVSEKELVKEVLTGPAYSPASDLPAVQSPLPKKANSSDDYLDDLDAETTILINSFISEIPKLGIKKVIAKARSEQPLILDAFHDVLVSKLYEELKKRGLVS